MWDAKLSGMSETRADAEALQTPQDMFTATMDILMALLHGPLRRDAVAALAPVQRQLLAVAQILQRKSELERKYLDRLEGVCALGPVVQSCVISRQSLVHSPLCPHRMRTADLAAHAFINGGEHPLMTKTFCPVCCHSVQSRVLDAGGEFRSAADPSSGPCRSEGL